ncbi:semaphorin-4E [Gadus morhua]|uniref:Si:ch211-129c21.1 n=1 Tax=Gadus morhua TaxID=8049 RepID=A0A8C4Z5P0_GADMO|nr:semaphorin-4E-like [Gadus morhua]
MAPPLRGGSILLAPPLFFLLSLGALGSQYCVPRKTFPYQDEDLRLFREEGVWNYSTMLLREEQGVLMLGAREAIYALDLHNISSKKAAVYWKVTREKQKECAYKGKQSEVECRNYIQTLHPVNQTTMYVCGTNAFSPVCDYMSYSDGQLLLHGRQEEGKGKCPFDPFQRYSSLMVGSDLYSATFINFLGSEPVVLRSSQTAVRTEFKSSWLNEPTFVYMDHIPESVDSADGDDDKVYLFFSEKAMEYDFYSKLTVSRVARVCKEDMGGQRTLQRKWTSFVKARLDCSLPEPSLPPIVQDVFLLKDHNWRRSVFYAVFTPQSGSSRLSAVCAFSVTAVREVFNEGKFKTPVAVETSHVKWVMHSGELPVPRPGACINNAARRLGMGNSLDLPDKTLQFIRDRPLMDEAVRPLTGRPLLVTRGPALTRIVVDSVRALDGKEYAVMFIGTENGFIQKAVNYEGEMFVIEETQVYEDPQPITTLRLSSTKGHVYAGSTSGVVQMPVSNCGRQRSCSDCVLARDPYCAWDLPTARCASLGSGRSAAVQSLVEGDTSKCPQPEPVPVIEVTLVPGNNLQLPCSAASNLAQVHWLLSDRPLGAGPRYYQYPGGLLLLNASGPDAGRYVCRSVERARGGTHNRTLAVYLLAPGLGGPGGAGKGQEGEAPVDKAVANSTAGPDIPGATAAKGPGPAEPGGPETQTDGGRVAGLRVAVGVLALLCLALTAALLWKVKREPLLRLLPWGGPRESKAKTPVTEYAQVQNHAASEGKTAGEAPGSPCLGNNHHSGVDFKGNGPPHFTSMRDISCLDGLGYINDESEI